MADDVVKYAKKHGKAVAAVVVAIFAAGGLFAELQAVKVDVETMKPQVRALELEKPKLDAMAEDLKLIKEHLLP